MNVLFLMVDQLAPDFLKFGPTEKQLKRLQETGHNRLNWPKSFR